MSFSYQVKTELCREPLQRPCCALAEAYGVLLYGNTFTAREIRLITGNSAFIERLPRLFRRPSGLAFDQVSGPGKNGKHSFLVEDPQKLQDIWSAFGYDPGRTISHHINLGVLEEECCRAAFVRGAFLAGGSVTDPGKRYHLELVTDHRSVGREDLCRPAGDGLCPQGGGQGRELHHLFQAVGGH